MSFKSTRIYLSCKSETLLLKRKVGPEEFRKARFNFCLNIEETDTFTSTSTAESFKINHRLNCDDNCLIYHHTCISVVVSNM